MVFTDTELPDEIDPEDLEALAATQEFSLD
jgi:hypothetical protein